ncbi:segregation and condensation protein A [Marichromatium bheemlicum]|uniref:Segregation and condensation protein A n=1 Tax=Marichromatium bheemlicum TaxID=365339 RepID=A0ABX1I7Y8_9GAMM|nr:segregation and condensation protein A [Marichromatium bheemlicum]NKN33669.1 segregation and condensation protein A [Marichromatium bheemlicum]
MSELSPEQQVLITMRKTLTAIVRDLTPPPGMRHPLSTATIDEVRHCLGVIAARERVLAEQDGRGGERPAYADQPGTAQVVPIDSLRSRQD